MPLAASNVTVTGKCNVTFVGSNNTITLKDCGIGGEQSRKIIAMLQAALSNRSLPEINAKLDELLILASKPTSTQSCVGSNCFQGTNNGQLQMNQFGADSPPPNALDLKTKPLAPQKKLTADAPPDSDPDADDGPLTVHPGTVATFSIDRPYRNPAFAIFCDRPCQATSVRVRATGSFQYDALVGKYPQITGVSVGSTGIIFAGTLFTVKVRSFDDSPVNVLSVSGINLATR